MIKSLAMIPLRMGSKRIPKKNIRLLDNLPLCFHIIKAVINSGVFEKKDIYLNTEDESLQSVASHFGISFYKRDLNLASDSATNDDFMYDFLSNKECDYVFQFLATSPLIKEKTIRNFTKEAYSFDTFVSVNPQQIECVYKDNAINFNFLKKTPPSQELIPIYAYACGLMGWKSKVFQDNYINFDGAAYHGGKGTRGFFELNGYETIDIDNEEDFEMASLALQALRSRKNKSNIVSYWNGTFDT